MKLVFIGTDIHECAYAFKQKGVRGGILMQGDLSPLRDMQASDFKLPKIVAATITVVSAGHERTFTLSNVEFICLQASLAYHQGAGNFIAVRNILPSGTKFLIEIKTRYSSLRAFFNQFENKLHST